MAKIVLAPYGSLGDLHPFLAIAKGLRKRGHEVLIATMEVYREKIIALGFAFKPLRPEFDPDDREVAKRVMDSRSGSEILITEYLLPNVRDMYDDLVVATEGADLLIAGEVVFASHSLVEQKKLPLVTTTLAPLSMFSAFEQNVFPNAPFLSHLNFLGWPFQHAVFLVMKRVIRSWLEEYRLFRTGLGLDPDHDPIVEDKYSDQLHLAMFSKAFGKPRPDWNQNTFQTGYCFYDGRDDLGAIPDGLAEFLKKGDPPIVFTLGSAAVMDPEDFFDQSIAAAKELGRRAIILYGIFNEKPRGLDSERIGFDYAPFGELFSKAACVVHQGGAGTVAQALRAGVPQLIVPFSHDQPDNAARCVRHGVARTIDRDRYQSDTAVRELKSIFADSTYKANAMDLKRIIETENGTAAACDKIEELLDRFQNKNSRNRRTDE